MFVFVSVASEDVKIETLPGFLGSVDLAFPC